MKAATLIRTAIVAFRSEAANKQRLENDLAGKIPMSIGFFHPTVLYQPGKGWLIDGVLYTQEAGVIVHDLQERTFTLRSRNAALQAKLDMRTKDSGPDDGLPF